MKQENFSNKKRGLLAILLFIFLISTSFISAYYYRGFNYYLTGDNILYIVLFLIFFSFIFIPLSRRFKNEKWAAAVIALGISFLIVRAIYNSGYGYYFSFNDFFYGFDLHYDLMPAIFWAAGIALIIFLGIKTGFGGIITAIGTIITVLSLTRVGAIFNYEIMDIFYQQPAFIVLGAGLIIWGIWLVKEKKDTFIDKIFKGLTKKV